MKKNPITLLVISLVLTGCSYILTAPIKTVDDEFKNTKTHTLEQFFRPDEILSVINSATITFSRKISNENENVNIYFVINRSSSSFKIEKKGFMKANANKFEILCESDGLELNSRNESKTTNTTNKDSTSVKTTSVTEVNTSTWYEEKFVVQLTPEMLEALLKTDELLFRFYSGPNQATFSIKDSRLLQIKVLLQK